MMVLARTWRWRNWASPRTSWVPWRWCKYGVLYLLSGIQHRHMLSETLESIPLHYFIRSSWQSCEEAQGKKMSYTQTHLHLLFKIAGLLHPCYTYQSNWASGIRESAAGDIRRIKNREILAHSYPSLWLIMFFTASDLPYQLESSTRNVPAADPSCIPSPKNWRPLPSVPDQNGQSDHWRPDTTGSGSLPVLQKSQNWATGRNM